MGKREVFDTESFIKKANEKHNGFYDYSKSVYTKSKENLTIICPIHGEFQQTPNSHLRGQGCPLCGNQKKNADRTMTTNEFITKAKEVCGDKYEFDKTIYGKNNKEKVCVTCKKHGDFMIRPNDLLTGYGCPKCANEENGNRCRKTIEEFINSANKIHNGFYDYSETNYINGGTPIKIICPEHGEFWQRPFHHLRGSKCPKCAGKHKRTTDEFIIEAKGVHGDEYDYSKVEYKSTDAPVEIICKKHGSFWQSPYNHLNGCKCPKCHSISKMEQEMMNELEKNGIKYIFQYSPSWLEGLRFDFYLEDFNIAVECQGDQHFVPVDFAGKGEEWAKMSLEENVKRDEKKLDKSIKNGVEIIYLVKKPLFFSNNKNEAHSTTEVINKLLTNNNEQKDNNQGITT